MIRASLALFAAAATLPYTPAELEAIPLVAPRTGKSVTRILFDGKTLNGWKGNLDWWSVEDGAICGKFNGRVPTSFLFTTEIYSDFRLTLRSKMVESDNHASIAFWGEIATKGDNQWHTQGPPVVFPKSGMWGSGSSKRRQKMSVPNTNGSRWKSLPKATVSEQPSMVFR